MKKYINTLSKVAFLVAITLVASCTKDFDEINTDPNNPSYVPNASLLSYSIVEVADRFSIDDELLYAASYVGHIVRAKNNTPNSYNTNPPEGMWGSYYVRSLKNLNDIIKKSEENENNVKAAAMVIKAYATMIQVDAYGDSPYFDASRLDEGISNPEYDSVEKIYDDLFLILDEANSLFSSDNLSTEDKVSFTSNDILYGDKELGFDDEILKWKKFTNSLKLRLATRINQINPTKSADIISAILSDATTYPIFSDNNDGAILQYPGGDWISPWNKYTEYFVAAAPLADTLNELKDPRRVPYFDVITDGPPHLRDKVKGLEVGKSGDEESFTDVSTKFMNNVTDGKVYFLTYSEIEFIKAEAAANGVTFPGADAASSYSDAITANMRYLDIDESKITTYLSQNPYNGLHRLYLQKWISLFRQNWEAWAEMRRTDVPKLPVAFNTPYGDAHNRVPFRFGYPMSETQKNTSKPTANIVDFYWGDRIWWDANPNRSDAK